MGDFEERVKQWEAAKVRMKALKFGDPVTNICAGEKNPTRLSFYVSHTNKWARCTDKKGKFWETGIEVIHPGHLDTETSAALFAPVWQARFGEPPAASIGKATAPAGEGGKA